MANALTNLYKNLKSKVVGAKDKVAKEAALFNEASADTANKAFDITQSAIGRIKQEKENVVGAFQDSYGGKNISDITNESIGRLAKG